MRILPPRARTLWPALLSAGLFAASAAAQTTRILPRGVVNAASFARPGLPNGSIARGSLFSIFGVRIGPADLAQATTFPLGTNLAGVTITITQGDTTVEAIPLVAVEGQINAVMPSDAPLGRASLQVRNGVRRSNPTPIEIVESSVGIFTATGLGHGPGSITNFISQTVQPLNTLAQTAAVEQVVIIWATGLGAARFPDNEAPGGSSDDIVLDSVEVWIGGAPVPADDILYAGRSPEFAGLDQIIVTVPAGAPEGCYVPIHVRTNGAIVSNAVTMAIGDCAAPPAPLRSATVLLAAITSRHEVDRTTPIDFAIDFGAAQFTETTGGALAYDRVRSTPPAAACLTYGFAGRADDVGLYRAPGAQAVDPGDRIRVSGPRGVRRLERSAGFAGAFGALLGGVAPGGLVAALLSGPYLIPGAYSAASEVQSEVSLDVQIDQPDSVDWTNRDQLAEIDRSAPITIEWTPPGRSDLTVMVVSDNYRRPTDSTGGFLCRAPASAGSITVPEWVLSTVPASTSEPFDSSGRLRVWTVSGLTAEPRSTAALDEVRGIGLAIQDRDVLFQ